MEPEIVASELFLSKPENTKSLLPGNNRKSRKFPFKFSNRDSTESGAEISILEMKLTRRSSAPDVDKQEKLKCDIIEHI